MSELQMLSVLVSSLAFVRCFRKAYNMSRELQKRDLEHPSVVH